MGRKRKRWVKGSLEPLKKAIYKFVVVIECIIHLITRYGQWIFKTNNRTYVRW